MSSNKKSAKDIKKRKFLRQEIIEENLDPQLFIAYISSQKPDAINISNWTPKELKVQIANFKALNPETTDLKKTATKSEQQEIFGNSSDSESESGSSSSEEEEQKNQNAMIEGELHMTEITEDKEDETKEEEGEEKSDKKKYKAKKIVAKMKETILLDQQEELKVEVSNPEVVKGGLFKGSYTVYSVYTQPFDWLVKRRFSDFIWLHDCLEKRFPANYVRFLKLKKDSCCATKGFEQKHP